MSKKTHKYDIICFAKLPWSNQWKRVQSLMFELSKDSNFNKIIFINPDEWISNVKRNFLFRYIIPKKVKFNIIVWTPVHFLPFKRKYQNLSKIEEKFFSYIIKRLRGNNKYIVYINLAYYDMPNLINYFLNKSSLNIFDFSDDFVELYSNQFLKNKAWSFLKRYVPKADIVISINEHVAKKYSFLNKNIYIIKNATNINNFRNKKEKIDFLDKLKLQSKILGYTGTINSERIDYDLLDFLVKKFYEFKFVFIGREDKFFKEWRKKFKNIIYIPSVPYNKLGSYINYFDVCIIPFKKNEHTKGNDLLKIYDYIAAGKPIITTNFGKIEKNIQKLVIVAKDKQDFANKINKIYNRPYIISKEFYCQVLKYISWENRAKQLIEVIQNHLKENA